MYKKEIERKWVVDKAKMPDLSQYKYDSIKQGYLSQLHDSLTVRVRSINDEDFLLELKDSGMKTRNEVTFGIKSGEFDIAYALAGQKTIKKRRYYVPSSYDSSKILEVDVYDGFDFITVEYEDEDETSVDSIREEEWFSTEVTYDPEYKNVSLAYKKAEGKI